MPSMEVYSGNPGDKVLHFEEWMQTTYHGMTAEISKWPVLSTDEKAKLFLSQLNKYFQERKRLLGDDESFLFPRQRPNKEALEVILLLVYCLYTAYSTVCYCLCLLHVHLMHYIVLMIHHSPVSYSNDTAAVAVSLFVSYLQLLRPRSFVLLHTKLW